MAKRIRPAWPGPTTASSTLGLSVVIPALNERDNIADVIRSVPAGDLRQRGYSVEVLVVDNGSTDGTGDIARKCGAVVISQPIRGYGSAYKAGFANCSGEIIATGDADLTYPFELLPGLLELMEDHDLDFLSTDRMAEIDPEAMCPSHVLGNRMLSAMSRALFLAPFHDSQSGMWVLRRDVWQAARVRSNGMAFSQELKHEAFVRGFRCAEVPISYRPRGGQKKLRTVRDGVINTSQLLAHRIRLLKPEVAAPARYTVTMPEAPVIALHEVDLRTLTPEPAGATSGP